MVASERLASLAILSVGLIWTGLWPPFALGDPCVATGADTMACLYPLLPHPEGATVLAGTLGLITILATITTIQRILHVRAQSREG